MLGIALGVGVVAAGLYAIRPRNPIMQTKEMRVTGFKLRPTTAGLLPALSVDLTLSLTAFVQNPNIVPVTYPDSTVDILYNDEKIGEALLEAGQLKPWESRNEELSAQIQGLEMGMKAGTQLLADVANRQVTVVALTVFATTAHALFNTIHYTFKLVGRNDVTFDPLTLGVTDSESKAMLKLFEVPEGAKATGVDE
eukprot:jgi/Mesen1/9102/ME000058S08590